jgi:hypothetical protein
MGKGWTADGERMGADAEGWTADAEGWTADGDGEGMGDVCLESGRS